MTKTEIDLMIELQDELLKYSRRWEEDDLCYCKENRKVNTYHRHCQECPYEPYWLPIPIDPVNPRRGLVGMINGFVHLTRKVPLPDYNIRWEVGITLPRSGWNLDYFEGITPTEAMLRAIKAQREGR